MCASSPTWIAFVDDGTAHCAAAAAVAGEEDACCCCLMTAALLQAAMTSGWSAPRGTTGRLSQLQISIMKPSGSWKKIWST
ncbi:Os05g0172000 [Oryza sativa Japonica Group]|uniref:Os05g0172000 protein n=1 Tax=Oryza sativa subsp. japonica TaxID=39947 RepID=Q0DKD2_ORYSJ|nr:Os05g0172000 [Oryza sativa Japonica Group]|eukprot:NP_001054777.1 Os05g0172000 [Oryza sativa Japonica Group]